MSLQPLKRRLPAIASRLTRITASQALPIHQTLPIINPPAAAIAPRMVAESPAPAAAKQFHSTPTQLRQHSHPSEISIDRYHQVADSTLDSLFANLERFSERLDPDLDVDFSSGVMTVLHHEGTFVINKQPPNRQIWLSSPISGPKRYDWIADEGPFKKGDWVYLRDGHLMRELLEEEIGVSYQIDYGE